MLGAVLGDIIGSPYEFTQNNIKTTQFPLLSEKSHFTDDTVMTIAVAAGAMNSLGADTDTIRQAITEAMRKYGKLYPWAGYGQKFFFWLISKNPAPYGSWGNGSAMRVSSIAWLYDDLETVTNLAKVSAEITHNHPEGIKGAQATADTIFLARSGASKEAIKKHIEDQYHYNIDRTPEMIRPGYYHIESCEKTVPEAITAFLFSHDFESAVRIAVSLGGDSDTLTAITGSIAEAAYGIPDWLKQEGISRLEQPLIEVYQRFDELIGGTGGEIDKMFNLR